MTGNSLAHKRCTLRKHIKKLKSLQISGRQRGKAGTRAFERNTALPKQRGYLLLTTDHEQTEGDELARQFTLRVKHDGQETHMRVLSAFSEAKRDLLGFLCS